ncbi:MAG TPA: glycosyltransferase family 2 protein [Stellaceae bacterium]|jgi:GT2 family glycosyltransferase|nr:glycosyltransferase family 2 protein [Stellaceae bacterium]
MAGKIEGQEGITVFEPAAAQGDATSTAGDAQHWRDIMRRLNRIERRGDMVAQMISGHPYQLARGRFRPRLWTPEQYASRHLRVPPAYRLEKAPVDSPAIAIVTPSLNQGPLIGATINSVLEQNYPNLSYLVQDGGSRDETLGILESYGDKLSWRSERDSGQANAINRGFRAIEGDIMGYLNSDDVLLPGTLAYVAKAFQQYPEVDIVYGHRIFINVDGFEIGRCVLPPHDAKTLQWADYVPQETLFWRRRVWESMAPFDESFQYALDWDFILRVQAAGFQFLRLPRFLACFRVHEQQKTIDIAEVGAAEMKRLRVRYLSEAPGMYELRRAISGYLRRQMGYHWMYRLGLLRY